MTKSKKKMACLGLFTVSALALLPFDFSSPAYSMDNEDKKLEGGNKSISSKQAANSSSSVTASSKNSNQAATSSSASTTQAGSSAAAEENDSSFLPVNDMGKALEEAAAYDSDVEYERHQNASERFFRRLTRKPGVRQVIDLFRQQVASGAALTPIGLDNLSSRTRILLFRELTAHSLALQRSIPFVFREVTFQITLNPSLKQPGDGIIDAIGTYQNIYDVLHAYTPEYQKRISRKLSRARSQKPPSGNYHPQMPSSVLSADREVNLEILNILLDFEVARRLQGGVDQEQNSSFAAEVVGTPGQHVHNEFVQRIGANRARSAAGLTTRKVDFSLRDKESHDSVPVASAIIGALSLSGQENPVHPLDEFFHATDSITAPDGSVFPYGPLNAFQGAPDEAHRAQATNRIIRELRGGQDAQNSTKEKIHQEYLKFFGGGSESEGSTYDSGNGSEDEDGNSNTKAGGSPSSNAATTSSPKAGSFDPTAPDWTPLGQLPPKSPKTPPPPPQGN